MNKYSLLVLLFSNLLVSISFAQNSSKNNGGLEPFYLSYGHGDLDFHTEEIRVYDSAGKFYAENIDQIFYLGDKSYGPWTTELSSAQIATCSAFINKAKSLPGKCPEETSINHEYTIGFAEDTIRISGECDWEGLGFDSLRKILFQKQFAELEMNRRKLINELNAAIVGKWYFEPLKAAPKEGDILVLTKVPNNPDCFWDFGSGYSFKSSYTTFSDLTHMDKYSFEVGGNNELFIESSTHNEYGDVSIAKYEVAYNIVTINNAQLKLKFEW